jgi:hypothetical protein
MVDCLWWIVCIVVSDINHHFRALKHLIKDLAREESSVVVPEVFANQLWWFGMYYTSL